MSSGRRIAIVAIAAFALLIVILSALPHTWHSQLTTAQGATENVVYHCGATWGSGYVHGPAHLDGVVTGTPCGDRGDLRVAGVTDVAVALTAALVVGFWRRPAEH